MFAASLLNFVPFKQYRRKFTEGLMYSTSQIIRDNKISAFISLSLAFFHHLPIDRLTMQYGRVLSINTVFKVVNIKHKDICLLIKFGV
jgi:hypothetical protein